MPVWSSESLMPFVRFVFSGYALSLLGGCSSWRPPPKGRSPGLASS